MRKMVSAAKVQRNFGAYQDRAQVAPVTVSKYGRPSVVIVSAAEYARLRDGNRRAIGAVELTDEEAAAIRKARIPARHRYSIKDLS